MKIFNSSEPKHVRKNISSLRLAARTSEQSSGASKALRKKESIAKTYETHPFTAAAVDSVARAIVGAGWYIAPASHQDDPPVEEKEAVWKFLRGRDRSYDNIKDYITFDRKIFLTVRYAMLFGQFAWEINRNLSGDAIGFDVISGIVKPNVDSRGYFNTPNFFCYEWGSEEPTEYSRDEISFAYDPGIRGDTIGRSIFDSLAHTTIPADLYAATAYRQIFENTNAPYNGYWEIDPKVSDEDFEFFVDLLEERYSGASNYGRNPLVIRGQAKFNSIQSRSKEDAPYLEGRKYNQQELSAVTGVNGNLMGLTEDSTKANMRESKRDFYENTVRPYFEFIEETVNRQAIQRFLGISGWKFAFNRPDFSNALEQATIDSRLLQVGIYSPNEIRAQRGEAPREGGDIYYTPLSMISDEDGTRTDTSDSVASGSDNAPERVSRDEELSINTDMAVSELRKWKRFSIARIKSGEALRSFHTEYVDEDLKKYIENNIDKLEDYQKVAAFFNGIIDAIEENNNA